MGLFGTTWDDPQTQGMLGAAIGLLNNTGNFGQGLGQGLQGFLGGYQLAKRSKQEEEAAKREAEKFRMQTEEYQRQLKLQQKRDAFAQSLIGGQPRMASLEANAPPVGAVTRTPGLLGNSMTPEQQGVLGQAAAAGYDVTPTLFSSMFPDPLVGKDRYGVSGTSIIDYAGANGPEIVGELPPDKLKQELTLAQIAAANARTAASNATAANAGGQTWRIMTPEEEIAAFGSDLAGNFQTSPKGEYKQIGGTAPTSGADGSLREQKIGDYIAMGMTREQAVGLADGRYEIVPDTTWGGYRVVDKAKVAQGQGADAVVASTVGAVPKEVVVETTKDINQLREVGKLAGDMLALMNEPGSGLFTEGRSTGATGTGLEGPARRFIGSTIGQVFPAAVSESAVRLKERADRLKSIAGRIYSANPNRTLAVELKAAADKMDVGVFTSRRELEIQLQETVKIINEMIAQRQAVLDQGQAGASQGEGGELAEIKNKYGLE